MTIVKDNITEGNENFHLAINSSTLPDGVTVDSTSDSDSEVTVVINDIDNGKCVCLCVIVYVCVTCMPRGSTGYIKFVTFAKFTELPQKFVNIQ